MTSEKHIKLGKKTALISFIIGTVIFGLYFLTSKSQFLFAGSLFIFIVGIFNIIILILILTKANRDSENQRELLKTSRIMLLNIPILFFYVWLSTLLIGNMRITFTNTTENKLTQINILGCETEYISELEPNESETIWVGITGDCSIKVNYIDDGMKKSEIVAGYVTSGMGRKMNHKIGGGNQFDF